ncbi:2-amino-4-hydroxy-6-hydroxymethyldihydropteridinediphosphokinase [Filimonas lacunae]|uniref:2-amino-4-hydroxy-6-hydroxymethyldihydropteridine pyrophosphokinase n=1 Tax=Filimonas lacunae TaxID=477680 RepID=A0A1N7R0D9_9BACT|nr:2-amino-4-hydroxy-6-hydroxymethyldihydropteridine diphosphokinase [Filimonas lacunae]SIT28539.1 2-amino-4-hydroxy-6-hydroxymethyldihydropteridinediphosphokinase [Filimonas lacunae]
MNRAYLLIGGNLGDRTAYLSRAVSQIQEKCGVVVQQSSIYETAAWGVEDQPSFYNQALLLHTSFAAPVLMQQLLDIETSLGRERTIKMGPRTIDIDVLLYNEEVIQSELITVPHPHLPQRRFALLPLAEIAPQYVHPQLHETITTLLKNCPDTLDVHKISGAKPPLP